MAETLEDQQHRAELEASRANIGNTPLGEVLRAQFPGYRVAFLLGWTSEQAEDIYVVLVDGVRVATIEMERATGTLIECEVTDVAMYVKDGRLRGKPLRKLRMAVAMVAAAASGS